MTDENDATCVGIGLRCHHGAGGAERVVLLALRSTVFAEPRVPV